MIIKNKRGFTLIELLVVIAIIGILSGMVLVSMNGARQKARDARRQSDMRQLESAQQLYYGSNSVYALDTIDANGATAKIMDGTIQLIGPLVDPTNNATYKYQSKDNTSDLSHFCYYAKLEVPITMNGIEHAYTVASDAGSGLRVEAPTSLTDCAPN